MSAARLHRFSQANETDWAFVFTFKWRIKEFIISFGSWFIIWQEFSRKYTHRACVKWSFAGKGRPFSCIKRTSHSWAAIYISFHTRKKWGRLTRDTNEKREKTLSQITNRSLQGNGRFWIPLHPFRIPDSLSVELGFRIPTVSGFLAYAGFLEPYSGFQSSGFSIPQQKSPGFRNFDSFTWDDTLVPPAPSPTPHFFPQKRLILRLNKMQSFWALSNMDDLHESM